MQVSEKEGEPMPVWNQDFRTACEVGLSLNFFGPETVHVLLGTEHKHHISPVATCRI